MTSTHLAIWGITLAAGCELAGDMTARVDVRENNDLGVIALQTDRFEDHGANVFELHGLDAKGEAVTFVHLRTGVIAGLSDHLPGPDNVGSEILFSAGGSDASVVTRETELFRLSSQFEPKIHQFLQLGAVSSLLERDAKLFIIERAADPSSSETGYATQSCPSSYVLSSPLAKQCCFTTGFFEQTRLVNPDGDVVVRDHNPSGQGCKASDGVSSCSGAACYYGPLGFGRPYVDHHTTPYAYIFSDWWGCNHAYQASDSGHEFPDETGTQATGQGCPGGDGGWGQWDY